MIKIVHIYLSSYVVSFGVIDFWVELCPQALRTIAVQCKRKFSETPKVENLLSNAPFFYPQLRAKLS